MRARPASRSTRRATRPPTAIDVPPPSVARVVADATRGPAAPVAGDAVPWWSPSPSSPACPTSSPDPRPAPIPDALEHLAGREPRRRRLVGRRRAAPPPRHRPRARRQPARRDRRSGSSTPTATGVVTAVGEDGTRHDLRQHGPRHGLVVASPASAWVAWTQPDGGDSWSTTRSPTASSAASTRAVDTRLIGWDRERLYFHGERQRLGRRRQRRGGLEPTAGRRRPRGLPRSALLDVSSGAELRSDDGALSVVARRSSASTLEVPGTVGQLSPDGNFVLTDVGDGRPRCSTRATAQADGDWFDERRAGRPSPHVHGRGPRRVGRRQPRRHLRPLRVPGLAKHYINSFEPRRASPARSASTSTACPVLAGEHQDLATGR